jgi:hypothetical protein
MSIESAVRTMLTGYGSLTVPDDRITHGYRLQSSALPAITFELDQTQYESIATNSDPLQSATVELRLIANTSEEALSYETAIRGAIRTGTFNSIVFRAVVLQGRQLESPVVADGDEAQPAQLMFRFDVYYR